MGELEKLHARLETLLSLVSHDIRAPLSVMSGAMNELTHPTVGQLNEEQRALVGLMRRSIERLAHLATNLSLLAKLETGHLELSRQRVDLCALLRDLVRKDSSGEDAAAVRVAVEAPAAPVFAVVDPVKIAVAVGNVLSNARRFAKSEICIRVVNAGTAAHIVVEDDGHGIPEGKGDVFERLPEGKTAGRSGSGLGLAVVRGITLAHGGSVRAENRRAEDGSIAGARFELIFPTTDVSSSPAP